MVLFKILASLQVYKCLDYRNNPTVDVLCCSKLNFIPKKSCHDYECFFNKPNFKTLACLTMLYFVV